MTSLTVALLFLSSIFFLPLFAFIPSAAAASALIYVGVLMMSNVIDIDFSDPLNAVPAFLTIVIMPLAYSITNGIGISIISYFVISLLVCSIDYFKAVKNKSDKPKIRINIVTLIITVLFLIYFLVPTVI